MPLDAPLNEPVGGTIIGQSIQVPNDDVPDDMSVLDMSWHDNGFVKSMNLPASSSGLPHSVSAYTLKSKRQLPSPGQSTHLDTSCRSDAGPRPSRPNLRRSLNDSAYEEQELSTRAEAAALKAFGAAATQANGLVRRKSTLVANDSSIDVSWFAKNGLMSRRSFEVYKKELKKESRQAGRRSTTADECERPRFLSKSAREFDLSVFENDPPSASDVGREMLKREKNQPTRRIVNKSRSLDDGLDHMVRKLVSALKENTENKELSRLKTKLSESLIRDAADDDGDKGLKNEDIKALAKLMMKVVDEPNKTTKNTESKHELKMMQEMQDQDDLNQDSLQDDDVSLDLGDIDRGRRAGPPRTTVETCKPKKDFNRFYYTPKRMNSIEKVIDGDMNTSDLSNMALSKTSDMAVTSTRLGLDTPTSTKEAYNESLSSMKPLVFSTRSTSGLTEAVVEDLHLEELQKEQAAAASHESLAEARANTPTRRASFESNVMCQRRSSSSLFELDHASLGGPMPKLNCGDILQEGMEYLTMTMLVNVYGKLREMSILGHASVKLKDIDVNSHQRNSRLKEMKRRGMLAELEEEENKGYLESTKTAEFVVRAVLDEYELLESSNELSPLYAISKANMQYDASLLSEFKTWVEESKVKQLDSVTEQIIIKLRQESAKRDAMMSEKASYSSLTSLEQVRIRKAIARRRNSLEAKEGSFQNASWVRKEMKLIEDHFESNGGVTSSFVDKKLQESQSDYFEEGSIMKNLMEASLEVVWFSDRHPNDLIYCICVNRQTKTVTVLFRARESIFNMVVNSSTTEYSNPISHEDYPGNQEFIKLRSAIADEMLRSRRDTKMSTIEEIVTKVESIGYELDCSGDYHVSVAGHGMAGSMATVLGYFLATHPNLKTASAVRVFSFASSPVGCKSFQSSFEHLERTGRILHARFTNSHDLSFFPSFALDNNWRFDGWYKNVGMHIRLHKSTYAGRMRTKKSLDVTYSTGSNLDGAAAQSFLVLIRILSSFVALLRGGWDKNSSHSVYQSRMFFARQYRLALGGAASAHRFDMKRKNLKTLNDYYLMKCRSVENYSMFLKQKDEVSWMLLSIVVPCLIGLELIILGKFISKW